MKKTRLMEIIREVINEELELESQASDDAKKQGLVYRGFGRWGTKNKITHTTQSGKLVPLKGMNPLAADKAKKANRPIGLSTMVSKMPAAQRAKNRTEPEKNAERARIFGHTGTDAGNRIVTKTNDRFWDTQDKLLGKYKYHDDIPADEFSTTTGIPKKAAVWTAQNNDDYEQPFSYDPDTDTFSMNDPMDV